MGFFGALGKIFRGEPVFSVRPGGSHMEGSQPPVHMQQKGQPEQQAPSAPVNHSGPKVLPQVMIERWQCEPHGQGLHGELRIRNYSQSHVTLQRIELMGLRDELGRSVDPGEHYEFLFNIPNRMQNIGLDECRLYFRDQTGDYFMALHQIEYEKLPDGTYNVKRFRLLPPIRDV
jgi:hypothetical protein